MSTTLVLGNGFDLGMNLKTSYINFFKSGFFPTQEHHSKSKMCRFLHEQATLQGKTWGGIEASLEEYAKYDAEEHTYDADIIFYQSLSSNFRLYLHYALYGPPVNGMCSNDITLPDDESCSEAFILECLFYDRAISHIVTFNYTPFESIVETICKRNESTISSDKMVDIINNFDVNYLHRGNENELVLGISNDAVLKDRRYYFLKKSHISLPKCFFPTLNDSSTIIFWGLSFSKCDQPYFREFFKHISSMNDQMSRDIFFVNYDSKSHERAMANIEEIMCGDITNLCAKNNVICVNTDRYVSSNNFAKLLLHLRESSSR